MGFPKHVRALQSHAAQSLRGNGDGMTISERVPCPLETRHVAVARGARDHARDTVGGVRRVPGRKTNAARFEEDGRMKPIKTVQLLVRWVNNC